MKQDLAAMMDLRKSIDDVFRNGYTIKMAIGKLIHEPTGVVISVYKPISRFKRLMLRSGLFHGTKLM